MEYKVIRRFRERLQNFKLYEIGDTYSYKDEKRIAFLIKEGYLKEIITPRKRITRKKATE